MPTEAELDWMIAVNIAPAITPNIGFENKRNRFRNEGNPFKQDTALLIVSIPNIRVVKPRRISPTSFFRVLRENKYNVIPIKARIGVKELGLSN